MPDLTLVVQGGGAAAPAVGESDLDSDAVAAALLEAADADPDRCVLCPAAIPPALPQPVLDRLHRLVATRNSLLLAAASEPADTVAQAVE